MPPVRKIKRFPAAVRKWLDQALADNAYGEIEAVTAECNERLAKLGHNLRIGKSAVGEQALRLKQAQESLAETTQMMQTLAEVAPDSAALRGEVLNGMVSEEIFKALLEMKKARDDMPWDKRLALMTKTSLGTGRISSTDVRQRKFRHEVEERVRSAADAVAKVCKTGGMKPAEVRAIKQQILGITKAPQAVQPEAQTAS